MKCGRGPCYFDGETREKDNTNIIPNLLQRTEITKSSLEFKRNSMTNGGDFLINSTVSYNLNQLIAEVEIEVSWPAGKCGRMSY